MKVYRFAFLPLLLAGCGGSQNSGNSVSQQQDSCKVIDLTETLSAQGQSIEEYLESIKVIPLETNSESVMPMIFNAVAGENRIFVQISLGDVYVFDLDGRFVKKLPYGQGPGEHLGAQRIKMTLDGFLYLHDDRQQKILKYDGMGNFLTQYPAAIWAMDFFPLDNGFLFFQDSQQNNEKLFKVISTDTLGSEIAVFPLGNGADNGSINNNFQQTDGGIIVGKAYDNAVFSYNGGAISKRYELVYDGMPEIDFSQCSDIFEIRSQFPEAYLLPQGILESKNFLYINTLNSKSGFWPVFYCKSNGKSFKCDNSIRPEYFACWMQQVFGVSAADGETFVGCVEPAMLLNEDSSIDYGWDFSNPGNLISDADMEKLKSLKPDDNPVIVLFKFKSEI